MAHYAFLDANNVVTEVITGKDEHLLLDGLTPEEWYGNLRGQSCVRTSYNNNIRKQYAGIGYRYDADADVFIAPQPYASWTLDDNYDWQPPSAKPSESGIWEWNEAEQKWER
jgi:hypothetical protein